MKKITWTMAQALESSEDGTLNFCLLIGYLTCFCQLIGYLCIWKVKVKSKSLILDANQGFVVCMAVNV
jgi:uncharacterized Tic20 family protein